MGQAFCYTENVGKFSVEPDNATVRAGIPEVTRSVDVEFPAMRSLVSGSNTIFLSETDGGIGIVTVDPLVSCYPESPRLFFINILKPGSGICVEIQEAGAVVLRDSMSCCEPDRSIPGTINFVYRRG